MKKNKERAVEEKAGKARRDGGGRGGKKGRKKEAEEEEDGMWARESWSGFPDGQREENMWVR